MRFTPFKDWSDYETAFCDRVLESTRLFRSKFDYRGVNIRPAFIRLAYQILSTSEGAFVKNRLVSRAQAGAILWRAWRSTARPAEWLKMVPGFLWFYHHFLWFIYGPRFGHQGPVEILVVASHAKFVAAVKSEVSLNNQRIHWFVESYGEAKVLGFNPDENIARLSYCFFRNIFDFPFSLIRNRFRDIEKTLLKISPKLIIYAEGDTVTHSLIGLVGQKMEIPVICFQWGITNINKGRTAFAHFACTHFLSWGVFFSNQLKPYNPGLRFIEFGPLGGGFSKQPKDLGDRVVVLFAGQPSGTYINAEKNSEFFQLIREIASIATGHELIFRAHPNQVLNKVEKENFEQVGVKISDRSENLDAQLRIADVVVSLGSSVLVDGFRYFAIPVMVNLSCLPKFYFPIKNLGLGFEANSREDAKRIVLELIRNKNTRSTYHSAIKRSLPNMFTDNSLRDKKKILSDILK